MCLPQRTWAYYGAMQESPLLGRKAHKSEALEAVHSLRSQSWGNFPELNLRTPRALTFPRVVINYIHGGPLDEEYGSKRKRQRLLRAALASGIKQMGLELSGLENSGRILSRFNGAAITSLGDVVLLVQVGPIILNVQFSVVEDLSPFNAILRRTWLHYMKVIPSTYHQMVSFLTKDEQIDLYGSQLAARQCYQVAREARPNKDSEPLPEPANELDQ
ncbi:hypothetical protein CK203_112300 [Vitis vinifera]|uniref:Uncharacterized protein n=1 Tax=Vitis vinifera TaxID=29760 RepID=A0A438CCT5_VITVI|nr:hypothetical protein CK203_112300 [Vitis vinifera]